MSAARKKGFCKRMLPTTKYRRAQISLLWFSHMVEITRVFWKKAYTSDAFLLGEIESAEVDMSTWQITSLYVGLTDEAAKALGFKVPFLGKVVVCLPVSTINTVQDSAVLNKSLAELGNLKQCKE
jgi:sporulation protein YlmC with PRC-barrel domain